MVWEGLKESRTQVTLRRVCRLRHGGRWEVRGETEGCPEGGGYEGRRITVGPVSGGGVLGDVMGTWGSLQ